MKKYFVLAVIVLLVVIGAMQFTSGGDEQETTTPQVSQNAYKDTIVFCQGNDLVTMDISIGMQERSIALSNNMFESLFGFGDNMEVIPVLAEEYEWLDDKTLKVKVLENVKFHDGSEMISEDIKYSMDNIDKIGNLFAGAYDSTECIDQYTVVIHMKRPSPTLLNILAAPHAGIVCKKARESDPQAYGQNPIGTGPYKLKEFKEGDYYTLERFDDYRNGPAKTKYITMRIVPESSQRQILVETGEVDVAYEIHPNVVAREKDNKNLKILTCDSMKVVNMSFNCGSKGPLGNAMVRKAILSAIDKQAIIDQLLAGYGNLTVSMVPVNAKDYMVLENYEYSIEKAKAMMTDAGFADGFSTTLWVDSNQTNTEIAQFIQNQLAKIGIQVSIIVQDPNTTFSLLKAGQDFGLIMDFFNITTGHGDLAYKRLLYSTSNSNWSNYKNPEYDKAYDEYSQTADENERKKLLANVGRYFIDDLPIISLFNEKKIILADSSFEGLKLSQIGAHNYYNATVKARGE